MAYYDGELLKQNFGKALNEFGELNVPISEVAIKIGQVIRDTPTADVVEVRHGRWITDEKGVVICSECGEEHEWQDFRPPYCDMCGAKMDGVNYESSKE